jgi:hypothetical protein
MFSGLLCLGDGKENPKKNPHKGGVSHSCLYLGLPRPPLRSTQPLYLDETSPYNIIFAWL